MTLLLSCQSISKSFGARKLFSDISLGFFSRERLGLIGPNGSGKSTLLKILAGQEQPDSGEVTLRNDILVVYLPQKDRLKPDLSVEATMMVTLQLEQLEEMELYSRLKKNLARGEFGNPDQKVSNLSGGWKKRLAISCAMARQPDLLLMDEPTNHLDLEGILWLEKMIKGQLSTFVIISHDRYFLENCTDQVMELNRLYPNGYMRNKGNYSQFLIQKKIFLEGQSSYESVLTNKLRRETEWLQKSPKARTTKARFRIDDAARLKNELHLVKARNSQKSKIGIEFESTSRKTKKLLTVNKLKKSLGGKKLFEGLDLTFTPGEKIGFLGRNGVGKSTLMKIICGDLDPDSGTVKKADDVKIILFDQEREQLNQEKTLRQALSPAGDSVVYRGNSVHITGWAKRFLFRPDQLETPVSRLSGGEQARILIANLMLQKADILLLDEPTNDLDIPSLEILEESLLDFPGAILLITHDRYLLDKISTKVLYLSGDGKVGLFEDYYQWQINHLETKKRKSGKGRQKKITKTKIKKLSYKEQLELSQMEEKIQKLEEQLDREQSFLEKPEIVADQNLLQEACHKLEKTQNKIDSLYNRWGELEELNSSSA